MCGTVTIFMPAGSVSRGASQLQLVPVLLLCAHRCFFALFLKRNPADVSLVKTKAFALVGLSGLILSLCLGNLS